MLLLFFEILQKLFDDIAIFFGQFICGIELQRFGVMLNGTFPDRLLSIVFLRSLTGPNKRVGEVVGRFLSELFIFGEKRLREMRNGLVKFSRLVSGRAGIELQWARIRFGLEPFFKCRSGLLVLPRHVILKPVGSSVAHGSGHKKRGEHRQCQRQLPASITWKNGEHQTKNCNPKRPLVTLYRLTGSEDSVLGELHWLDAFLEYFLGGIGTDGHKKSACRLGDFVQSTGIQLGIHRLT